MGAKSNEITATPALLALLAPERCTVTIDTMGCQTTIAEQIIRRGADDVLVLKANQGTLPDEVRAPFALAQETNGANPTSRTDDSVQTADKSHGRLVIREG